jgi:hypothetical protein
VSVNVEAVLLDILGQLAPGKSASPEEVARAADPEGWRGRLPQVRAIAVGLARDGRVTILRHNKPADPDKFRGVYRLRLPLPEDGPQA